MLEGFRPSMATGSEEGGIKITIKIKSRMAIEIKIKIKIEITINCGSGIWDGCGRAAGFA